MVRIDLDLETQRRAAEYAAASANPASCFTVTPPKISPFAYDTISKAAPNASSISRSVPVLDVPKSITAEDAEIGRSGVKPLYSDSGSLDPANADDLMHMLYRNTHQAFTENLAITRDLFTAQREFSDVKENERMQEMQSQISLSHKKGLWTSVEKSLLSFGLIAAGVAGIAMGAIPLGIAGICIGTLMVIDRLLDDAAKKAVAVWLAKGDQEKEQVYTDRIHIALAGTSMALSFGLAGPAAVTYGIRLAQVAVGGVKSVYEWRFNKQKASMIELGAVCQLAQKDINSIVFEMQQKANTLRSLDEMWHEIEERTDDTVRLMVRN